ncbi:hypothetical protein D3C75_474280 [compost metagenome]
MKYIERVGHLLKQREYTHDKIAAIKNSGPLDIALVARGKNIGIDRETAPEVREAIEQILIKKAKSLKEELSQLDTWMQIADHMYAEAAELPTISMEPVEMTEDILLDRFSKMMRQRMMENTHKKHWGDCSIADLKASLNAKHHMTYLETSPAKAIQHYTDVANYCMMIVDNLQRLAIVPQDETQGYNMVQHVEGSVPTEKLEKIMGRKGKPIPPTPAETMDADFVQEYEHNCCMCDDVIHTENEHEEYPCCEKPSCHDALTRRLCT